MKHIRGKMMQNIHQNTEYLTQIIWKQNHTRTQVVHYTDNEIIHFSPLQIHKHCIIPIPNKPKYPLFPARPITPNQITHECMHSLILEIIPKLLYILCAVWPNMGIMVNGVEWCDPPVLPMVCGFPTNFPFRSNGIGDIFCLDSVHTMLGWWNAFWYKYK